MQNNANSKANVPFQDYVFTKMATGDAEGFAKECKETNVITSRKTENMRRCLCDNLLLIVTVTGVVFGVILGESAFISFLHVVCGNKYC